MEDAAARSHAEGSDELNRVCNIHEVENEFRVINWKAFENEEWETQHNMFIAFILN